MPPRCGVLGCTVSVAGSGLTCGCCCLIGHHRQMNLCCDQCGTWCRLWMDCWMLMLLLVSTSPLSGGAGVACCHAELRLPVAPGCHPAWAPRLLCSFIHQSSDRTQPSSANHCNQLHHPNAGGHGRCPLSVCCCHSTVAARVASAGHAGCRHHSCWCPDVFITACPKIVSRPSRQGHPWLLVNHRAPPCEHWPGSWTLVM